MIMNPTQRCQQAVASFSFPLVACTTVTVVCVATTVAVVVVAMIAVVVATVAIHIAAAVASIVVVDAAMATTLLSFQIIVLVHRHTVPVATKQQFNIVSQTHMINPMTL